MSAHLSRVYETLLMMALLGSLGCSPKNQSPLQVTPENTAWRWSRTDALRVLVDAAESENPGLRALALPALVNTEAGTSWLVRGWHDPSVSVQRSIAMAHPKLLTENHLLRPGADPLAVAWVLQEYPADHPLRQKVVIQQEGLVASLFGVGPQTLELLSDLEDGMLPPEPLFIELLVRSGVEGVGEAMARGAIHAEDEMRLPLAVAALQVAPEAGSAALNEVLRDADEMTLLFATESLTRLGDDWSVAWLKRAIKEDGSIREYAKAGLMALGIRPFEDGLSGLTSPDRDLRTWAARCFGIASMKRPLPRNVILALQGTWKDESAMVRQAVTHALMAGGGVVSVPLLAPPPNSEVDALAVLVAGNWLLHHRKQGESPAE